MLISGDGESFDNMNRKSTVVEPVEDPSIGCRSHARDPKVWRGKNAWYMVVGSTSGGNGRLLFYRSTDLKNWEYVNYASRDDLGWMWECPDYFEVDGAKVLMVSPMGISEGLYHDLSVCMTVGFDEERCEMQIPDIPPAFIQKLRLLSLTGIAISKIANPQFPSHFSHHFFHFITPLV